VPDRLRRVLDFRSVSTGDADMSAQMLSCLFSRGLSIDLRQLSPGDCMCVLWRVAVGEEMFRLCDRLADGFPEPVSRDMFVMYNALPSRLMLSQSQSENWLI
jgi:hypothetical protein